MVFIHCADRLNKMVLPYLDAMRDTRRAQKQKVLEQLVVVSTGVDAPITKECIKTSTVLDVLKNCHIHPWLARVRIHT
jgi:hypothetical protein